jgi:hypothetical protein
VLANLIVAVEPLIQVDCQLVRPERALALRLLRDVELIEHARRLRPMRF